MNFRKFISGVSALAIAASAFAGIAVTVNAADVVVNVNSTLTTYVDMNNADIAYSTSDKLYTGYNSKSGNKIGFANTDWGVNKIAYAKFDVSALNDESIQEGDDYSNISKAELCFTADAPSRGHTYWAGYTVNETWGSDLTYNNLPDDMKINTDNTYYWITSGSVTKNTTAALTLNVTDYVKSDTDGVLSFFIADLAAGGGTISVLPTLKLTWAKDSRYKVTFTESNGLSPAVTVYSDSDYSTVVDTTDGLVNGTYYYKAVLTGYYDKTGTVVVNGADVDTPFTMSAKTAVTSVNVKYTFNNEEIASEAGSTAGLYIGDKKNIPFRKYIVKDGVLYETTANKDNPHYGEPTDLVANTVVEKTLSKSVIPTGYEFVNMVDADGSTNNSADIRASYMSSASGSDVNLGTVPAGTYKVVIYRYSRSGVPTLYLGDNKLVELTNHSGSWGTATTDDVIIGNSGVLTLKNTNATDFILLYRKIVDPSAAAVHLKDVTEYSGEAASVWAFTVDPGTYTLTKLGLKLNGEGNVQWDSHTLNLSGGPATFATVINKVYDNVESLALYVNNGVNPYNVTKSTNVQ